jgi:uncharacterized protein YecE (DUF72 family)
MNLFVSEAKEMRLPAGARVFLGTSGYSFPDWRNVFYPRRITGKDWLRYYALKFNSVEINSTWYRILSPDSTGKMADSVPEGFTFSVKLHSSMTHSLDAAKDHWSAFHTMLMPFVESGRMGMVLAQFPWSFPLEEKSFGCLASIRENLADMKAVVEFRHERWYSTESLNRLYGIGFTPVSVDLPAVKGLPGTGLHHQSDTVYLRLHGRNSAKWWGNTQQRYNYLYQADEMSVFAKRLGNLSNNVKNCYVFFNNCHMGKAALNAADMQKLLSAD